MTLKSSDIPRVYTVYVLTRAFILTAVAWECSCMGINCHTLIYTLTHTWELPSTAAVLYYHPLRAAPFEQFGLLCLAHGLFEGS